MNLLCLPLSSGLLSLITRTVLAHSYSFPFLEDVSGNVPALPGLCRAQRSLYPLSFNFLLQEMSGKCTYIREETLSTSSLLSACGQWTLRVWFCRPPSPPAPCRVLCLGFLGTMTSMFSLPSCPAHAAKHNHALWGQTAKGTRSLRVKARPPDTALEAGTTGVPKEQFQPLCPGSHAKTTTAVGERVPQAPADSRRHGFGETSVPHSTSCPFFRGA